MFVAENVFDDDDSEDDDDKKDPDWIRIQSKCRKMMDSESDEGLLKNATIWCNCCM